MPSSKTLNDQFVSTIESEHSRAINLHNAETGKTEIWCIYATHGVMSSVHTCRRSHFAFSHVYTCSWINSAYRMSPEQLMSQLISHHDAGLFKQLERNQTGNQYTAINYTSDIRLRSQTNFTVCLLTPSYNRKLYTYSFVAWYPLHHPIHLMLIILLDNESGF